MVDLESMNESVKVKSPTWQARVATIAIGVMGSKLESLLLNYLLYPFVIWWLGLLWGGLTMSLFSLVECYALILFYDWAQKDWLGIELIKSVRDEEQHNWLLRKLSWLMNHSTIAALVVLSLWYDPFITTAYLRRGSYNGLSRRDWYIFLASWALSNGFWILVSFGGVSLIVAAWHWLLMVL